MIWAILTGGTVVKCSSDPGGLGSGNDPPVAADGLYTVAVSGTVTGFMKATDPDGRPLTYAIVAGPGQGSLQNVDAATGRFTYVPRTTGVDSFSFRASNGLLVSNVAVITIQIFNSAAGVVAMKPSGAAQVADDPLTPGATIVLWNDGKGTLQRIYRGQRVPAMTLATDVRAFSVDPLAPATIVASLRSGTAVVSEDGGSRWREGALFPSPCRIEDDGPDPEAPMAWHCPILPEGLSRAVKNDGGDSTAPTVSLIEDRLRAGTWRLAVSGPRTLVMETRDGGLSWTVLRELEVGHVRLATCEEGSLCLLDRAGTHLWRFDADR